MSLNTLIPQPLPVYNNIEDSYFYRKDCGFKDKTIVSDLRHIPSFILNRDTSINSTFTFEQVDREGNVCTTFTISETPCFSNVFIGDDVKDIIAFDFPNTNIDLCCGYYHIKITDGNNIWYTELINFKDFNSLNSDYTKIEFANDCNIEGIQIPFRLCPDFRFRFYLNELNGECCPVRTLESEIEQDNLLQDVETSKVYKKSYNFKTFLIPHFLVDAFYLMSTITETGYVNIYPKKENQNIYTGTSVKNISIEKIGEDKKCCFEQLQISFQRENNIVNNGCCGDIGEVQCVTSEKTFFDITDSASQNFYENAGLGIDDCFFINTDLNNTGNDWSSNVGKIAVWNGSSWNYTDNTSTIVTNNVNGELYELSGGVFVRTPIMSVTNNGPGTAVLKASIPDGYLGSLCYSDDGINFTDMGGYSTSDFSSGIAVIGFPQRLFRVKINNYNCEELSNDVDHTFNFI